MIFSLFKLPATRSMICMFVFLQIPASLTALFFPFLRCGPSSSYIPAVSPEVYTEIQQLLAVLTALRNRRKNS